jgi:hypothetical protein
MSDTAAAVMGKDSIPTTTVAGPQTNTKGMSPMGQAAYLELLDVEKAKIAALQAQPGPMPDVATPESVDAEIQSRENSKAALDRNFVRNAPDPFAAPVEVGKTTEPAGTELPPKTSQEFNSSPEIKGPQTLEAAQDETARYSAEAKARDQAATMEAQQKLQAQIAQHRLQVQQDILRRAAEYQKASTGMTSFWEDKSIPQKIMLGLAMGRPGGRDKVQEAMNADMEMKKAKLDAMLQQHRMAGASEEQLNLFYDEAQKNMLANHLAKINMIDLTTQKILSRYPQAQKNAAVTLANEKAKTMKGIADLATSATSVSTEGEKTTTVTGKQSSDGRNIPVTADEYTNAQMMARKAQRAIKLMKDPANVPTGKDLWELRNRRNQYMANLEAEKKGSARVFLNEMLRGGPGFPDSTYPKEWSQEKKDVAQLGTENAHMVGLKRYGQTGLGGEHYMDFMGVLEGQPGESQQTITEKYKDLFDQSVLNEENYRNLTKFGRQEDIVARAQWTPAEQQARAWAVAHPNDPRAKAINAKLIASKVKAAP